MIYFSLDNATALKRGDYSPYGTIRFVLKSYPEPLLFELSALPASVKLFLQHKKEDGGAWLAFFEYEQAIFVLMTFNVGIISKVIQDHAGDGRRIFESLNLQRNGHVCATEVHNQDSGF